MSNVIITGATGMVGKGVLLECINSPHIKSITLISRSAIDIRHDKIKEILLNDFTQMASIKNQLKNIDGCFHCMGVSSVGLTEAQFSALTFDITKALVDVCYEVSPKMTFTYVSGSGTDTTEKGSTKWARVKGKTENYILQKGFVQAFMFRPGMIIPENGIKSRTKLYQSIYNVMRPFFPLLKKMQSITTSTRVGQAMINSLYTQPINGVYLENRDINLLGEAKLDR